MFQLYECATEVHFLHCICLISFLFGMKITDYTLDITIVYACKLRNIHCISNIFKIQLFFHFVKFELLIVDSIRSLSFSLTSRVQKYTVNNH